MGNDELQYAKAEVKLWCARLIGRCQAVADMPADRELARARKCLAVDELLCDVVLCLSGVAELLEAPAVAATPAVARLLEDLQEIEDLPIREDFILEDNVLALRAVCTCGRDRGEHLVEAPHASEDGTCLSFVAREVAECLCDQIDPSDRPCLVCETLPVLPSDAEDTLPPPAMPAGGAW